MRLLLLLALLLTVGPLYADEPERELKQLQEAIQAITAQLEKQRQEEHHTRAELARLEKQIGRETRRLEELRTQQQQTRVRLQQLQPALKTLEAELQQLRQQLAVLLRQAWQQGNQPALKLLLNQEDPADVSRMLHYYRRINAQQMTLIEHTTAKSREARLLRARLQQEESRLAELAEDIRQRQQALQDQRRSREGLLADLRRDIRQNESELERLTKDQKRLQALVDQLRRDDVAKLVPSRPHQPFGKLKGRLPMPVDGQVEMAYRHSLGGGLRYQGVRFASAAGRPVRSVAHGRVVFADWLNGLGLLLIVDHGDGYLSLYGHNDSLYREVGDWVETDEQIASVGTSGGLKNPALHFEIRHKGRPINPLPWIKEQR